MDINNVLGVASQLTFIVAFIWYITRIMRGGVKVSVGTFSILSLTSLSQAVALVIEHAWYPAVFMALTTVVNTIIVVLGLRLKNYQFKKIDVFVLIASIIGIVAWILTHSAAWNVYILSAAILVSYIPIFLKTYKSPQSEAKGPWVATLAAAIIFLFTITSPAPIDWIVQVRQFVFSAGMAILVVALPRHHKNRAR